MRGRRFEPVTGRVKPSAQQTANYHDEIAETSSTTPQTTRAGTPQPPSTTHLTATTQPCSRPWRREPQSSQPSQYGRATDGTENTASRAIVSALLSQLTSNQTIPPVRLLIHHRIVAATPAPVRMDSRGALRRRTRPAFISHSITIARAPHPGFEPGHIRFNRPVPLPLRLVRTRTRYGRSNPCLQLEGLRCFRYTNRASFERLPVSPKIISLGILA